MGEDAELAIELVQFAYFKKVLDKGKRRKSQDSESEDDVEEQEDQGTSEAASKRKRSEEGEETQSKRSRKDLLAPEPAPVPVSVDETRYKYFMELNKCVFEKNQATELEMSVIRAYLKKTETKKPFSEAEIDSCIERMSDENKVMRSDDTVFIIV